MSSVFSCNADRSCKLQGGAAESGAKSESDRVVLQLHGGGYIGAMRNKYRSFAGLYNEIGGGISVFTPDYRVAPENPYPAALEDALDAWNWLLESGRQPAKIVIAGDSAGGGLRLRSACI